MLLSGNAKARAVSEGLQSEKGDWCGWVAQSAVADIPLGEVGKPCGQMLPSPRCRSAAALAASLAMELGDMNRKENGAAAQGSHYRAR